MPYLPPLSCESLWEVAPSTIEPTSPTLISKSSKTNNHSLFPQNNWEKVWILIGEPLSLHRVFHSIRFKVNKVGIQWYPIFFALHLGLIGKQPLFFSPSPICAPARPAVCRGVASVCATTQETGQLPAGRRRGAAHRKGHFPIAPREWCLATETTAIVRWGNALSSFATALGLAAPVGTVVGRRRGRRQHQLYLRG